MRGRAIERLAEELGDRDRHVLISLERFRLLSSRQLQRLHFVDHATDRAAARACSRCLKRLHELGLVAPLQRRIGGVRSGSAGLVWQLAATGERFLRALHGEARRRRYVEPGTTFADHTLAVNEVVVGLLEATHRDGADRVITLEPEPANWRSFLGAGGERRWLKPDLHVIATGKDDGGKFDDHIFVEMDLGTEHVGRVQAKCRLYAAYAATGLYQAVHEIFPLVVWLAPDRRRRHALQSAVTGQRGLPDGMFQVSSPEAFVSGRERLYD